MEICQSPDCFETSENYESKFCRCTTCKQYVTATVQSSSIMTAPEENSIIVVKLCMLAVEAKGSSSH